MSKPSRVSRASGRITLADVAREAGVSPITASRALRADRNVAAELVARVREAAQKLHYQPDAAAQSLASRSSRNVVLLVPLLSNRVFGDLVEAVQGSLQQAGYQTLIGVTHYHPAEEEKLLHSYLRLKPAGVILTGSDHTPATLAMLSTLAGQGVPCVRVMELGGADDASAWSVGFSQRDAGRAITGHLVERGRRRIAFAGAQLDPRVMQRAAGWREALEAAGLTTELALLDPRPSSIALGAEMLERLLKQQPDAIFFCNDDLAQGALLAALRLGLRVPQQLAIAGFNDLEGSAQMLPPLSTVRTPRAAIGERAARLMLDLLAGTPPASRSVDLGFELILREST
ncbi:LacI family DNA-binding transcriptional regulator [Pelomonas sp. KK5]|uniref:LacI family DNA-binding transcriptional regulator n=1 Tax=Pelomonas sp. KK5 TaxID=1855730 RepID=UPI00097C7FA0|nr:LacI family DNA-binding transcriptional regulator [Pelomonas sp. KK5]